jgi:adenylate kinase
MSQVRSMQECRNAGMQPCLCLLQVLVEKCLGRRMCSKCGKNYNIADIFLPATADGRPEIVMPPLSPPPECMEHMEQRSDDTEPVVRRRLEVYAREARPVERFYAERGKLLDFEIVGGIPEVSGLDGQSNAMTLSAGVV